MSINRRHAKRPSADYRRTMALNDISDKADKIKSDVTKRKLSVQPVMESKTVSFLSTPESDFSAQTSHVDYVEKLLNVRDHENNSSGSENEFLSDRKANKERKKYTEELQELEKERLVLYQQHKQRVVLRNVKKQMQETVKEIDEDEAKEGQNIKLQRNKSDLLNFVNWDDVLPRTDSVLPEKNSGKLNVISKRRAEAASRIISKKLEQFVPESVVSSNQPKFVNFSPEEMEQKVKASISQIVEILKEKYLGVFQHSVDKSVFGLNSNRIRVKSLFNAALNSIEISTILQPNVQKLQNLSTNGTSIGAASSNLSKKLEACISSNTTENIVLSNEVIEKNLFQQEIYHNEEKLNQEVVVIMKSLEQVKTEIENDTIASECVSLKNTSEVECVEKISSSENLSSSENPIIHRHESDPIVTNQTFSPEFLKSPESFSIGSYLNSKISFPDSVKGSNINFVPQFPVYPMKFADPEYFPKILLTDFIEIPRNLRQLPVSIFGRMPSMLAELPKFTDDKLLLNEEFDANYVANRRAHFEEDDIDLDLDLVEDSLKNREERVGFHRMSTTTAALEKLITSGSYDMDLQSKQKAIVNAKNLDNFVKAKEIQIVEQAVEELKHLSSEDIAVFHQVLQETDAELCSQLDELPLIQAELELLNLNANVSKSKEVPPPLISTPSKTLAELNNLLYDLEPDDEINDEIVDEVMSDEMPSLPSNNVKKVSKRERRKLEEADRIKKLAIEREEANARLSDRLKHEAELELQRKSLKKEVEAKGRKRIKFQLQERIDPDEQHSESQTKHSKKKRVSTLVFDPDVEIPERKAIDPDVQRIYILCDELLLDPRVIADEIIVNKLLVIRHNAEYNKEDSLREILNIVENIEQKQISIVNMTAEFLRKDRNETDENNHKNEPVVVEMQEVLEERLEKVWKILGSSLNEKLSFLEKYSNFDRAPFLPKLLSLLEEACQLIVKRENALKNLESFEKVASNPRRLFVLTRKELNQEELLRRRLMRSLFRVSNQINLILGDSRMCNEPVLYFGQNYLNKMEHDYSEMLFKLQKDRTFMEETSKNVSEMSRSINSASHGTIRDLVPVGLVSKWALGETKELPVVHAATIPYQNPIILSTPFLSEPAFNIKPDSDRSEQHVRLFPPSVIRHAAAVTRNSYSRSVVKKLKISEKLLTHPSSGNVIELLNNPTPAKSASIIPDPVSSTFSESILSKISTKISEIKSPLLKKFLDSEISPSNVALTVREKKNRSIEKESHFLKQESAISNLATCKLLTEYVFDANNTFENDSMLNLLKSLPNVIIYVKLIIPESSYPLKCSVLVPLVIRSSSKILSSIPLPANDKLSISNRMQLRLMTHEAIAVVSTAFVSKDLNLIPEDASRYVLPLILDETDGAIYPFFQNDDESDDQN